MSRGIAARKPGEVFYSLHEDNRIILQTVLLFNDHQFIQQDPLLQGIELVKVNQPTTASKSAIVALFDNQKGYVKHVSNINNNGYGKWTNSDFKRETGYVKTSGASSTENIPIKPSNLIGDEKARSVSDVEKLVLNRSLALLNDKQITEQTYEHLSLLFNHETRSKNPLLKDGFEYLGGYNKYLSEILAPISIITNWNLKDDANHLSRFKSNITNSEEPRITYFQNSNNVLVDSMITYGNGVSIGVSSKIDKGGGAAASVGSLIQTLDNMNKDELHLMQKKYPTPIQILRTIYENSQVMGIIELAKMFDIVDIHDYWRAVFICDRKINYELTDNLKKTLKCIQTPQPQNVLYRLHYHLLAGLAKRVVLHINEHVTDLDSCIRDILKHDLLYQVYSSIELVDKKHLRYKEFKVIYPPCYDGKIKLDASKNYFMTGIKGKLCFKLK